MFGLMSSGRSETSTKAIGKLRHQNILAVLERATKPLDVREIANQIFQPDRDQSLRLLMDSIRKFCAKNCYGNPPLLIRSNIRADGVHKAYALFTNKQAVNQGVSMEERIKEFGDWLPLSANSQNSYKTWIRMFNNHSRKSLESLVKEKTLEEVFSIIDATVLPEPASRFKSSLKPAVRYYREFLMAKGYL